MAPHNIYLSYKKDTKYLLYWMINVSNRLLKSADGHKVETPVTVNTTGQTTVAGLISMSKLIAERREPIPSVIYRLFGSIIEARSVVSDAFQQLVGSDTDEELKRSNASHKHFIDTLRESFSILGGDTWAKTPGKDSDVEDDDDDQPQARKASRRPAKGKKGKKNKKQKKAKKPATVKEDKSDEIPIESIKIIEDEDFRISDYFIAVYSAVKEWVELRAHVQGTWREVAYNGLNGAVAGAISNMALSMIKRTTSTIFANFPGHDTYETIMKTMTRGNPDKAQGTFILAIHAVDHERKPVKKLKETAIDVREQFLIYAYQDLVDFITDYQANRSGKPTKAMQTKITKWDPSFNLQKATEQERLDWRRCYTIRWLFDLVNQYSSVVVQRNTLKGEKHVYERVDWSANGPWGKYRTMFGLNEFAGEITSMAMKKPGTNIRKMIQPHHVFQVQCIVDAFAVSRGWSLNALRGHILEAPAKDFRPKRDVDFFLGRTQPRMGMGYLQSVDILEKVLETDGRMAELRDVIDLMQMLQGELIGCLGETQYMEGLKTIPPSRFSDHNSNGLWEYSPFLCGIGLMEGLELSYRLSMILWERMPEAIMLIHLHHAAVQKGYLTRPVELYEWIEYLMKESFFVNGKPPASNFGEALVAKIGEMGSLSRAQRRAPRRRMTAASNVHEILDLSQNTFYQKLSNLALYRKADWNIDAIPDSALAPPSLIFFQRVAGTKKIVDPDTKRVCLEETPLVRTAKVAGIDDKALVEIVDLKAEVTQAKPPPPQSVMDAMTTGGFQMMPDSEGGYVYFPHGTPNSITKQAPKKSNSFFGTDLLYMARMDMVHDVQGDRPLSGLNYLSVAISFTLMFSGIEDRLREAKDPAYIEAFERPGPQKVVKRALLTTLALSDKHDKSLRLIAEVLESHPFGLMDYIYWGDLRPELQWREKRIVCEAGNECTLM